MSAAPAAESTVAADPIEALPFPGEVADCCVARPLYRVVLPTPAGDGPPAQLLLCGHHFRATTDGLARARAAVFDSADCRVA